MPSTAFDQVVVTAAGPLAADLCPDLTRAEQAGSGRSATWASCARRCCCERPLAPYYLTYITDPDTPFTAVVEMTQFVDPAELGGHTLVYLPKYVAPDDPLLDAADDEVRAAFWPYLQRMYPDLRDDDVLAFQVSRVRRVFAVPTIGFSATMPPMDDLGARPAPRGLGPAPFATLNVNETLGLVERVHGGAGSMKPIASLSLDLDNLWSYQMTHGDEGWDEYALLPRRRSCPRVLEFLAARAQRITFFVVGQDAALDRNEKAVRAIADDGHEIGNHSFRHEPWLHRYSHDEIHAELGRAEEAHRRASPASAPIGFRGPGYSLSADVLRGLVDRGYRYDCSTLPTVIGPLARWYYFRIGQADRRAAGRARATSSAALGEGLRPLQPYGGRSGADRLLEIPVTTLPLARVPINVSYVLYLAEYSPGLARQYFANALRLCRLRRRRAVDPAPPARLPRRRRRRRARASSPAWA